MTQDKKFDLDLLACPNCLDSLVLATEGVSCVSCGDHYPAKNAGGLDLHLRGSKIVNIAIEIGSQCRKNIPTFGVITPNPDPEVRYDPSELPIHLSSAMASHIPRAPSPGSLCLDLGCGAGDYRKPLETAGYKWVGLDYGHIKAPLWADAHALPFPDNSFDFVISLAVLEHIEHPAVMLREVCRVLKPGGAFLGSVTYLVPFHDGASYNNMTHHGVWAALTDAGLDIEFIHADPVYLGIRAIAYSGLFTGLKRSVAYAIVEPIVWLHRLYWFMKRVKSAREYGINRQMLLNTGAFVYKAFKPIN